MENVLEVKNLVVDIRTQKGIIHAVRDVSFSLRQGETLAVVGESGCGKSMTMKAVMQILPKNARITDGQVLFHGKDLSKYSDRRMEKLRGSDISMIFQDPMTSLNPTMKIGKQIEEVLKLHRKEMTPASPILRPGTDSIRISFRAGSVRGLTSRWHLPAIRMC